MSGSPVVSLSPTNVNFGNEALHKISAPQYVTLSNTGSAPLTINTISSTSNNYSQSNNCPISPNTLAAGSSCLITVRFTPSATGARTGSITINDNASDSPQAISLTGTGVVSYVTLSSTDLVFAVQLVNTSSTAKTIKLTNTSTTAALNITGIAINGDFALATTTGQCPSSGSVAAKGSCNLAVKFSPTAAGTRYGTITITDSDAASPQVVGLSGVGTAVSLSVKTLNMGSVVVGQSSKPKAVTMSNVSSTPVSITGITLGGTNPGDYSETNTCGSSLAGGAKCSISATFKPTATGTRTASISIADSDPTSPQTIALTGIGTSTGTPLSVTTSSLAAGVVGTSYSQTLQAAGGTTPYSWSITAGSLPAGLLLNASTGAITGTPTGPQVGPISFTATVTDSEAPAQKASASLSITISAPVLSVTTTSLPGGTLGTAYNQALAAAGGITPYTWSITAGALPAGLTLNPGTGVIAGTPTGTVTGQTNFTVTVTDSEIPAKTAGASLSITIVAPPLTVVTSALPSGTLGTPYNQTLAATGGITPYAWSITAGALPAGLTLNPSTGVISGTPTGTVTGQISFTATVADSQSPAKTASASLSITITVPPLVIATTGLPGGIMGESYSATLAATGGIAPYSWSITSGSLPAGLTLNSNGQITGKPTADGTSSFTVKVTDSETPTPQSVMANLSITVNDPLQIITSALPAGVIKTPYAGDTLAAMGGNQPYAWSISAGSLPPGLSLAAATGMISGTPTQTGTFNFTAQVTDSSSPLQTATANLSITVNMALTITTTSLPSGNVGTSYSQIVQATGGVTTYSWSITSGSLPAGLNLNSITGQIYGTPTTMGTSSFTVTVADSETPPAQVSANLSITINKAAALQILTHGLPGGSEVTTYAATLLASGGIQPYTWSISTGSLPGGLNLNASTGTITGTPTATGPFNFTVQVTDSASTHTTTNLSINVITCTNNSTLSGNYAALMEGWYAVPSSPSVQTASVRSFVADGAGNITTGKFDTNDQIYGPLNGKFVGTYCIGSNNLGLMTLNETVNGNSSTNTFAFALNSAGTSGQMSYYDNSNISASGPLRKQTTTAFSIGKLNGNYAFQMIGSDGAGFRSGMAGQYYSDGKGNLTGVADMDDNGTVSSQITLTASNFTILSNSTGRGDVTITFSGAGGQTSTYIFYVVNATEMLIMEDDPAGSPLLAGHILQQTGGGSFTDAALTGNIIFGVQSLNNIGTPVGDVSGGIVSANGSGSASYSFDDNHAGAFSTLSGSATYNVTSNGRVALTGFGGPTQQLVLYMVAPNQGFLVGTDYTVAYGEFYPQSGSNFTNASVTGTFKGGSDQPENANAGTDLDSLTIDGAGNLTQSFQTNGQLGPQQNATTNTCAVSSSGRVVVSQGASQVGVMYIVNSNTLMSIPAAGSGGNNGPTLDWFAK